MVNFSMKNIVKVFNPYFLDKGTEQKVIGLEYNSLLSYKEPKIVLDERET